MASFLQRALLSGVGKSSCNVSSLLKVKASLSSLAFGTICSRPKPEEFKQVEASCVPVVQGEVSLKYDSRYCCKIKDAIMCEEKKCCRWPVQVICLYPIFFILFTYFVIAIATCQLAKSTYQEIL